MGRSAAAGANRDDGDASGDERQRLDKWMYYARVVKTRALAIRLIEAGHVRVNGQRNKTAHKSLRAGDVLTIALDQTIRVLKVRAPGERRGPYSEAQTLYEDLSEGNGATQIGADGD